MDDVSNNNVSGSSSNSSSIDLADWIWTEIKVDEKRSPIPRQLHTGVVCGDQWYIFGGFAKEQPLDDLWILSLVTKEWRQVKKLMRTWPQSRHSHTANFRSVTKKIDQFVETMIIFGGVSEKGEVLNDVWEYSYRKSSWSKLETSGDIPSPRYNLDRGYSQLLRWGHSAVIHNDKLWVFGGFSNAVNNELYCLNLASLEWRRVISEGPPDERHFHSANICHNKMFIFGGLAAKNLGDMWCFDFESHKWELVQTVNEIPARRGHQSFNYGQYLAVHGGRDNHGATSDLFIFDLSARAWETIKADINAAPSRYFHKACLWHNNIVVFGGLGVGKTTSLDANGKALYSNLNDLYYFSFKGNAFSDVHSMNGRLGLLPFDVLKYCLEYLDAVSLSRLSCVNRFFYYASSAENLWKKCVASIKDKSVANMNHLESGYKRMSKTNAEIDDIRIDDLLDMMRRKLDIRQFYWKHSYILLQGANKGAYWLPSRSQKAINTGYEAFEKANTTYVKILLIGSSGVGKTCIGIQFYSHFFIENYDPTIDDGIRKQITIPGRGTTVMLDVDEVSGYDGTQLPCETNLQEFVSITENYIRFGKGIIIVYSIASRESFEKAAQEIERVIRVKEQHFVEIPMILVGFELCKLFLTLRNKCDLALDRQVTAKEGIALAMKYDIPFYEASAKTRINIDEQFYRIVEEIAYKVYNKPLSPEASKKKDNCIIQ